VTPPHGGDLEVSAGKSTSRLRLATVSASTEDVRVETIETGKNRSRLRRLEMSTHNDAATRWRGSPRTDGEEDPNGTRQRFPWGDRVIVTSHDAGALYITVRPKARSSRCSTRDLSIATARSNRERVVLYPGTVRRRRARSPKEDRQDGRLWSRISLGKGLHPRRYPKSAGMIMPYLGPCGMLAVTEARKNERFARGAGPRDHGDTRPLLDPNHRFQGERGRRGIYSSARPERGRLGAERPSRGTPRRRPS